jgi:hypothetical protein
MSSYCPSLYNPYAWEALLNKPNFDFQLLCSIITHSWSWALLGKPPIMQPLENFPAFYGTRRFITVFTRALHWFLSWARSIQSIPSHPISLRSILILSTPPTSLSSQWSLSFWLSHQYPICIPLSPIHSTCPVNLILLNLIILIILREEYKL